MRQKSSLWGLVLVAFLSACASVERRKTASAAAAAQLRVGNGSGIAPRHTLREWRLDLDTGGFVQLVLSSSGTYLMRHGYYFTDKSGEAPVMLMLSESSIGNYSFSGASLSLLPAIRSSCPQTLRRRAGLDMEVRGKAIVMDEASSRNLVLAEFNGRRELPFHHQFMGTLDASSPLPTGDLDPDASFESRLGCVQRGTDGNISFNP